MQKFIIFLFLAVSGSAHAAHTQALDYYHLINKAELEICDSNFRGALVLYKQAFVISQTLHYDDYNKTNRCNSYDLYNAFMCAMETRDSIYANEYLDLLLYRGVDPDLINRVWNRRFPTNLWRTVSKTYEKRPNGFHNELPIAIDSIIKLDQLVRKVSLAKHPTGDYMTDSIGKIDYENAKALYTILKRDHIGTNRANSVNGNGIAYNIIILHYMQGASIRHYQPTLFDTLLVDGIYNLDFSPTTFAAIMAPNYNLRIDSSINIGTTRIQFPISLPALEYNGKRFMKPINKQKEAIMDRNRALIGLPPLADIKKKLKILDALHGKDDIRRDFYISYDLLGTIDTEDIKKVQKWLLTTN